MLRESESPSEGSISRDEPRVVWLKTVIAHMLGILDPVYVNTLIRQNLPAIDAFFRQRYETQNDLQYVVMFVWRTFYDRLIEEEITVLEEVPRPSKSVIPDKKGKGKKGKGDTRMTGGKSAGKGTGPGAAGGKGRKKGGQEAPSENEAAAPAAGPTAPAGEQEHTEDATGGETTDAEFEGEGEGEEEATVAGSVKSSARSKRKLKKIVKKLKSG